MIDEDKFYRLADEWESETRNRSSQNRIANHPKVREIVAMGADVVPLIIARMKTRPWFWFSSLTELTGDQPITHDMRGNMQKMTEAWITWGLRNRLRTATGFH